MAFKVKKSKKESVPVPSEPTLQAQLEEAGEQATETEEEERPRKKPSLERAETAERPEGWVEFVCQEVVDPSPTIGSFSFSRDLSVIILEKSKTYTVPRFVAEVLVDKKKGIMIP
jgi:hypothetical protein